MAKIWNAVTEAIAWVLRLRIVRAVLMYNDHRGGLLAAAITFRALFAVFAAVLLGFSLASLWLSSRSDLWDALVESVSQMVPGLLKTDDTDGVIDVSQISSAGSEVTIAGIVGTFALLWALISAVGNLRMSLRMIAGTRHENDAAWLLRIRDLLFALSIGVLVVASAVISLVGSAFIDTLLGWLGLTGGGLSEFFTRLGVLIVAFLINAVMIAWLFVLLSGVRASFRAIVPGALIGGVGLVVLQQLSGLFVGGADNNPLLTSFASLIALLLWFNFSAQVTLIASTYIVVTVEESHNRVGSRYGAETLKQRAVRSAEREVRVAEEALQVARHAEREERERTAEREEKLAHHDAAR
ncbi:YihY/virulence factor BrkB family protein [Microbacterium excoecariae]|uniref:YihY/virulence factor BrkB family protein n=1 Tax=Microbacterium excoecariae TaxID=2715210 RepID=UPI00140E58A7|nr:YihY/virulence factor BrkB family protein [Microbacterium excoecariae]NHI16616.1 YihY/virulence factor BrkB family protein [Microbacterium excoecariae]